MNAPKSNQSNYSHSSNSKQSKLTIPTWAVADRPREKYMATGGRGLSDAEIIAILLRTGTADLSAVDLAKQLMVANGNSLNQLAQRSISELVKLNGIGYVKAVTLHAAFELGRRRRAEPISNRKKILSSQDILELMQSQLAEQTREEFWVIYLNQASTIISTEQISVGGWTATIVDTRIIIKRAIELQSTGIVLCHNHPSGNMKPSHEDIQLTMNIVKAADLFNIKIIDHIILHNDACYSFCAEGLL